MLRDEEKVGLHAALTPTWSETAWLRIMFCPMGFSFRASRPDEPGIVRGEMDRAFDNPLLRGSAGKRRQEIRLHVSGGIREKFGKRMNSGSTFRGRSIPTVRWELRQWFESPYRPVGRTDA